MCKGRLFHRRAAATGNALSPTVDIRVRRTSRDVDEGSIIAAHLFVVLFLLLVVGATQIGSW